jgi:hypothetical protein
MFSHVISPRFAAHSIDVLTAFINPDDRRSPIEPNAPSQIHRSPIKTN